MAFPGSITLLPDIIQTSDGNYTETFTIPGSPYTYKLGSGAPLNYPTGMQVIPPAGVSNAVTLSGGGHGSWTQVASAPAAGQFTVDTSVSPTGGVLGFNSADATQSVTATYVANTYANKALFEAWVTALRDLNTLLVGRNVASGFAGLDGSANLQVLAGHKIVVPGQTANTSGSNVANQSAGTFAIPNGSTSGGATSIANTLVTATSIITLTPVAPLNNLLTVGHYRVNDVAGASFGVQWATSAALTAAVDVHFQIVN